MKHVLLTLLLCIGVQATESKKSKSYTILAGVTAVDPAFGYFPVFQGGEVGITFKEHHYFGLNAHAYNAVEKSTSQYDSLTKQPDFVDTVKHYGNIYGAYFYEFPIRPWLLLAPGIYAGIKYAEEDRNWDTTVTKSYRIKGDSSIYSGELHLRHEAEGRCLLFGAPAARISIGFKPVFLTLLGKFNIGRRENWGFYNVRDSAVSQIYFDSDYTTGDLLISEKGWHLKSDNSLFTKPFVMPEWTIALMIRF